jgi:hypothetical protein
VSLTCSMHGIFWFEIVLSRPANSLYMDLISFIVEVPNNHLLISPITDNNAFVCLGVLSVA